VILEDLSGCKISFESKKFGLLFTNFETLDALNRQIKYLRGIAKNHFW
jgi:hypothetical protein